MRPLSACRIATETVLQAMPRDVTALCCLAQVTIAWGSGTIVICFRGTASMKNVLHDMKACASIAMQLHQELCPACAMPRHPP